MPVILNDGIWFPNATEADGEGLVAMGGDLRPERLLAAYRQGIFPWSVNPITWWSPDPRGVIELDQFHVSRSLARVIRQAVFDVTMDRAFGQVIEACATPGPKRSRTWITSEFIEAYMRMHQLNHAHNIEY